MTNCRTDRDLLGFCLGELSVNDAKAVGKHVEHCAVCARGVAGHRRLLEAVGRSPEGLSEDDAFVERVRRAIPTTERASTHRSRSHRLFAWGLPLVAALGGGALAVRAFQGDETGTWTARGPATKSAEIGAEVVVVGERETFPVEGRTLGPSDALGVRVWNRTRAVRYLMAFGIDARGELHWFYPAYTAEGADPRSVPIDPTAVRMLGEVVQPEHVADGRFRVVLLMTDEALRVKDVEAALLGGKHSPASAFPKAITHEHIARWETGP